MWIRSQDNEKLVNVDYVSISEYIQNRIYGDSGMSDAVIMLGEYESKERAIEVLDDIQRRITLLEYNKIAVHDKSNEQWFYGREDFVFEMPKE